MSAEQEPTDRPPARDAGLAAERTDIAWARSGLAIVTCLAAVLRRVPSMRADERYGLLAVLAVGVVSILVVTRRHSHSASSMLAPIDTTAARLRSVAGAGTAVGLLCLAVVLTGLT